MLLLHGHYVVFRAPKGTTGLRVRLKTAPPPYFNGIGHQFVVPLGRPSFAEPPHDVEPLDRAWLEQPARDVIDLVMAGPENESVLAVFQEGEWLLVVNSPTIQFRVVIDAGHT